MVAWFIPFKPHIQKDNSGGARPALSWGRAYVATNDMINRAGRAMQGLIANKLLEDGWPLGQLIWGMGGGILIFLASNRYLAWRDVL